MLAAGWSILVGLGVLLASATPAAAAGMAPAPRELPETESKHVDLAGNLHLVLGAPDSGGNFAVCLGTRVGIGGTDPNKRAAAVADLESRRDFVSKAFHDKFGNSSLAVRSLDILNGDIAAVCICAPTSSQDEAAAVVLELLRPSTPTAKSWLEYVQRWQSREGLASAAFENPLQHQLQSLVWLGSPEATASITHVIEQSLQLQPERVTHSAAVRPSKVVLGASGDYSPAALEKFVRSHPLVREFMRATSVASVLPQGPAEIRLQTPRFTWLRTESVEGHVWLFGWPITHLDASHALNLEVLAQLLERHLGEQTPIGKSGTVTCIVQPHYRYGSFIVEVRSKSLDLATVDKWVHAGMDWLKNGQFSLAELSNAVESAKQNSLTTIADPIERAWAMVAGSYFPQDAVARHSIGRISPSDVSRLAKQDFEPRRSAEIYAEAVPPRAKGVSSARRDSQAHRAKGSRAITAAVQTNRRPGRIYAVQNGESLQMIARRFRVTVPEIIRENRLSHPDQIRPGTKIFVPQPESSVKMAK